jgi:hypothetical protein
MKQGAGCQVWESAPRKHAWLMGGCCEAGRVCTYSRLEDTRAAKPWAIKLRSGGSSQERGSGYRAVKTDGGLPLAAAVHGGSAIQQKGKLK